MKRWKRWLQITLAIAVVVLGGIAYGSIFTLSETSLAIVLNDGAPQRAVVEPGIHLKWPTEDLFLYDNGPLDLQTQTERVNLADFKPLMVDSVARYRIADPMRFYEVDQGRKVNDLLARIVNATLRRELGRVSLTVVLSDDHLVVENQLRDRANYNAKRFGAEFVEIRFRCADPDRCPEAASGQ